MLLEVRDIHQNSFKIAVKLTDTILQVKEKIESKFKVLDVDDQKLVYFGNILLNDSTVQECEFQENDYATLIYNSYLKDIVRELIEELKESGQLSRDASSNTSTFTDDNSRSFEADQADSRDTSQEVIINADENIDSESEELSRYAILESIPDIKELCKLISNNPVELPKMLSKMSRKGPSVFEKILENQHAYIDLLNRDEYSSNDNEIKKLKTKDREAIDRFMKKGYDKETILEVYQACDLNENVVDELLNYLH